MAYISTPSYYSGGYYYFFGTTSSDTIVGTAYADILYGDSGDDAFYGGFGQDHHYGGDGLDTVYFTHSSSYFYVDLGGGYATADGLSETLNSIESVVMGSGGSQVIGSSVANYLFGGSGSD